MKRLISWTGLLLTFTVQPMFAKDDYPLTIKVLSTKNLENKHGTFHLANGGWLGGHTEGQST